MGRGRAPCCEKIGLNKGSWTPAEDMKLITYIHKHGHGNWRALPKQAGLLRCGKSCRLRWINYLRPDIKRGNFTREEEEAIIKLHGLLGNKWSKIASCLPGRTDNEIKNVWNTHLKKQLSKKPREPSSPSSPSDSSSISSLEQSEEKSEERPNLETTDPSEGPEGDPFAEKIEIPIEPNLDMWGMLDYNIPHLLDKPNDKDLNMWDMQLDECLTSSGSNPSNGDPKELSSSSSLGTNCNLGNDHRPAEEKPRIDQDSLDDIPNIPIEPELWNMIDGDSCLFDSGDHNNPTTLGGESTGGGENKRWLEYLEEELDLWGAVDGDQQSITRDAVEQLGLWEESGGVEEMETDPVSSYFLKRPSSPSPLDTVI